MVIAMLYSQSDLFTHFDSFYLPPLYLYRILQAVGESYFLFVTHVTEMTET
jgi:hypothetical protein